MNSSGINIPIHFPTIGSIGGNNPIVVIGPNGVGKSRLMRSLFPADNFISSQRRTFLEDRIPSYSKEQSQQELRANLSNAHSQPWALSNEIDTLFARVLGEHFSALDKNNEAGLQGGAPKSFVSDTTVVKLRSFWHSVFTDREFSFADFAPTVSRKGTKSDPYQAKAMSDGERSCLYLAARVLTAEAGLLVVDEPELHLHRKLAVDYWNKLEEMRPDIRFVYVTHELNFALSRDNPEFLVVRDEGVVERASIQNLPAWLAEELLGAATLTINADRIIFFEGLSGRGLAYDFFKKWINGRKSAALGMGNRKTVLDAGSAFSKMGIVANAKVISVIDRDHGPEGWLNKLKPPAFVLEVHEIESLFALPEIVRAIAKHSKNNDDPWPGFLRRARDHLETNLAYVVAERVRARFGMLMRGIFDSSQINGSVAETMEHHKSAMEKAELPSAMARFFPEEEQFVRDAMNREDHSILIVLSGKVALNLAASTLGVKQDDYSDLVLQAIEGKDHSLNGLIVPALAKYLPARE